MKPRPPQMTSAEHLRKKVGALEHRIDKVVPMNVHQTKHGRRDTARDSQVNRHVHDRAITTN
jgi:hypothetical protein